MPSNVFIRTKMTMLMMMMTMTKNWPGLSKCYIIPHLKRMRIENVREKDQKIFSPTFHKSMSVPSNMPFKDEDFRRMIRVFSLHLLFLLLKKRTECRTFKSLNTSTSTYINHTHGLFFSLFSYNHSTIIAVNKWMWLIMTIS